MTDDGERDLDLFRRTVLQGTAGLGALGLAGGAAGRGSPGGRPPSTPPPDDGGGGGGDPVATVTLITGHTIQITERGDDRHYTLVDEDAGRIRVLDSDDATYVVPDGANLELFSRRLFDVEFLVEQGVTDEETDSIPVVVSLDADVDGEAGDASMAAAGFSPTAVLSSIDAVAGSVAKAEATATSQRVLSADVVEKVHFDTEHEALLDTSAEVVNAPAAREAFGVDGSGASIAVLDTGIDADHPDFGDRVVHQTDLSGDGVADGYGHGTHVAGIAAGAGTESDGEYVGVAPGADLLNVKVLGDDGSGRLSTIVQGIEHAVEQGADVLNLSLGGTAQEDGPLVDAVDAAVERGVVAAVAAGNTSGYETVGTPGIAERALTVGASDGSDGVAGFSSAGPTPYDYRVKPEVVAPGVDITATGSEDAGEHPYATKSGTSMATPHVAGVAALLLADDPERTPDDVRDRLASTADRLDGEDVFRQGGGVVDAAAALDADLRVHDAVVDFGLFTETTTDAATVTVENTGSEAVELDVTASLTNVQSGDDRSGNVGVAPSTVTVAPGATESVELEIDTEDAFGYNSGVLTFEAGDGTTYRTAFGFVRGFEITVERNAHERNDPAQYSILMAWDHEASFLDFWFAPFFFGSDEHSFVLLDDEGGFKEGGEFTFWLVDKLESGDPVFTVKQTEITPDNTHVTLDETSTVPRVLDTGQVGEHEPFEMRRFDAGLDAVFPDLPWFSYGESKTGAHDVNTLHVSPIAESQPTTVSTAYLMYPEATKGDHALDNPVVYHLFYGARSVSGPRDVVTVDADELAAEAFEYHRTRDGEPYAVYPHFYPADSHNHPKYISIAFRAPIGGDRVEQTWYRNAQTRYTEYWDVGPARFERVTDLVPEPGATYDRTFNRDPLAGRLSTWSADDGSLDVRGHWYTDQADAPFMASNYGAGFAGWNAYSVSVDGDDADTGFTGGLAFTSSVDVDAGSDVTVSLHGNTLAEADRGTATVSDYRVTHRPDGASAPPQVDSFDVVGLDTFNRVPAGQVVAFVDVTHDTAGVADFRAFYAPTGATSATPFEDASGWREADVAYAADGRFGVVVDVAGYAGSLDLAVAATDAAGNRVETTTFDTLEVSGGATRSAPTTVRPDELDLDANQVVPVRVAASGGVDPGQIAVDTLRLGPSRAVHDGRGASPVDAHRLGTGDLQVKFAAADTGFACDGGPVAAYLAGELVDGTVLSGADVIPTVTCDDR